MDPLQLPELLSHIASFLTKQELDDCLLVCKDWHRTLLPLAWKKIQVQERIKIQDPENTHLRHLLQHREFIRTLDIQHTCPDLYAWNFPRLHSLKLIMDSPTAKSMTTPEDDPINLIERNPSLTQLSIIRLKGLFYDSFWDTLSKAPNLCSLHLQFVNIIPNKAFWSACQNLEELHLISTVFLGDNVAAPEQTFPRMRSINFSNMENFDKPDQLCVIRQCRKLEQLSWRGKITFPVLQEFVQDLVQGNWPNLESLDPGFNIPHPLLSHVLDGMKRATKLNLSRTTIKPPGFLALRRHFDTLVTLDDRGTLGLTSDMIREILYSCPKLEEFKSGSIDANDIASDKPWVCTSLKVFQCCFVFDKSRIDSHREIFERLSKLKQLESLHIGDWSAAKDQPFQEALDLRLESGLGLLKTLKNIKFLNFFKTIQKFDEKDIQWMISNWRKLESTYGCLHPDPDQRAKLTTLLKGRGVKIA
ncbi:hypothetical protein BGZ49_006506 [Haplosporangium sp. Z 27]|nr:hypothetical protein BGZ49_006506 [Haplosporangium sp. Z 27]